MNQNNLNELDGIRRLLSASDLSAALRTRLEQRRDTLEDRVERERERGTSCICFPLIFVWKITLQCVSEREREREVHAERMAAHAERMAELALATAQAQRPGNFYQTDTFCFELELFLIFLNFLLMHKRNWKTRIRWIRDLQLPSLRRLEFQLRSLEHQLHFFLLVKLEQALISHTLLTRLFPPSMWTSILKG